MKLQFEEQAAAYAAVAARAGRVDGNFICLVLLAVSVVAARVDGNAKWQAQSELLRVAARAGRVDGNPMDGRAMMPQTVAARAGRVDGNATCTVQPSVEIVAARAGRVDGNSRTPGISAGTSGSRPARAAWIETSTGAAFTSE